MLSRTEKGKWLTLLLVLLLLPLLLTITVGFSYLSVRRLTSRCDVAHTRLLGLFFVVVNYLSAPAPFRRRGTHESVQPVLWCCLPASVLRPWLCLLHPLPCLLCRQLIFDKLGEDIPVCSAWSLALPACFLASSLAPFTARQLFFFVKVTVRTLLLGFTSYITS
jgi:hypothetical protein